MDPSIALPRPPPDRFAEFLSSASRRRVKPKRDAMEQPKSDEDQQLVARTQAGEAAAFDQLVVKYTPRLYGLVYNMTSNHEDTNDLLQDVFSKGTVRSRLFYANRQLQNYLDEFRKNPVS